MQAVIIQKIEVIIRKDFRRNGFIGLTHRWVNHVLVGVVLHIQHPHHIARGLLLGGIFPG